MAAPQLSNGYTRIANELLDMLPRLSVSGAKLRIVLCVIRYTFGYQRTDHEMGYDFVALLTGLHRKQVASEVKQLLQMRILTETKAPTSSRSRKMMLNTNYEEWEGVSLLPVSNFAPSAGSNPTDSAGSNPTDHKKKVKKIKKASASPSMDQNADNAAASFRSGQLTISKAESSRLMVEYQIGPDVLQAESEKMTKWINDNPKKKPKDIIGFVDRWLSKLTPKQPQVEKQPIQYLTAGEEAWVESRV